PGPQGGARPLPRDPVGTKRRAGRAAGAELPSGRKEQHRSEDEAKETRDRQRPCRIPPVKPALALVALAVALPGAAPRGVLLGHSVQGRKILAVELGDPAGPPKALVVGCIHGNECA